MRNQCIVVLVDSQAAIKSFIKCTVTLITELNCIRNLNLVGQTKPRQYCLDSWSCRGVHGNEVANYLVKSESKSYMVLSLLLHSRMPVASARG